jgi:hypothetical protein
MLRASPSGVVEQGLIWKSPRDMHKQTCRLQWLDNLYKDLLMAILLQFLHEIERQTYQHQLSLLERLVACHLPIRCSENGKNKGLIKPFERRKQTFIHCQVEQ